MPLFKSLRSKSSRQSNASTTSELDNTSDFGPRSPSSTTYGSVRSTKNGATDYRPNSKRSLSKVSSSAPSSPPPALPRYASSSSVAGEKGMFGAESVDENGEKLSSMMQAVNEVNPSTPTGVDPSMIKPRPSELFAGKGVQWDAVKLAGPNTFPTSAAKANTSEDMQNFLKMRRQWKPTFATESNNTADFKPPQDLSQLTFASGNQIQSQGLMSLKDLDESHSRKQKLLSSEPLGGSLWDEPETSTAASKRAAGESAPSSKVSAKPPAATRKESSKGRKLFGGAEKSSRVVPPRSTSAKDFHAEEAANESVAKDSTPTKAEVNDAVTMPGGLAPPISATTLEGNPASTVRESMESGTNQFETPNGSSTELAQAEDGDKTLTANGDGKVVELAEAKELGVETAPPSDTAIPTTPLTPRAVQETIEERSVTPTPQNT